MFKVGDWVRSTKYLHMAPCKVESMSLPSKELFEQVLNVNLMPQENIPNTVIRQEGNEFVYFTSEQRWGDNARRINVYELAHKCKEWAKLLGVEIDSHCGCARWGASAERHISSYSVFYEQVFIASTEHEAIFKACDYILNELSNK